MINNKNKKRAFPPITINRKIPWMIFLLLAMTLCSACSKADSVSFHTKNSQNASAGADPVSKAGADDAQSTAEILETKDHCYMILKHDIQNYQITLMDLADGEQCLYEYTDGTEFFDKYGNYTLREDFSEGKLAAVERMNSNDTLGAVAFTDDAWDYEDVVNYTIYLEKRRMDIADTAYQLDQNVKVFSEGEERELTAIGESDVLNVYGIGRTIYAIVVSTGHGTLALANTELFEGGWVNLGTKVYAKVTRDMTMELPEGIYEFSVANDGYGDSGEIRIRRDKLTTIDLNDYKGEGPKLCKVTFDVGVAGAIVTVDGKKVNHKKPVELRYGVHTLGVYAEGYDAWTKQLVVNSKKAKIEILLSSGTGIQTASGSGADDGEGSDSGKKDNQDKEEKSGKDSATKNNGSTQTASSQRGKAGSKAGSRAGSYTGGSQSGQTDGNNSASGALADTALGSSLASIITGGESTDYLDTLSDLVDSLDRLNKRSSSGSDRTQDED